jgi:hypothetical protein
MVYLHTQNPNLGIFWRALHRVASVGLRLENVDIFYGHLKYFIYHLDYFTNVWEFWGHFGIFSPFCHAVGTKKSGNPALHMGKQTQNYIFLYICGQAV